MPPVTDLTLRAARGSGDGGEAQRCKIEAHDSRRRSDLQSYWVPEAPVALPSAALKLRKETLSATSCRRPWRRRTNIQAW
jgi:hypothetical protein